MDTLPPIFSGKKKDKTAYLHQPPSIKPNYGKRVRKSLLPKTNISRVLLYDNAMQDSILEVQLNYLNHQMRGVRFAYRKNRYTFVDIQRQRRKRHEALEGVYQRMKDAYIAQYGTRNMPVPEEEPEIDPFIIYARLAPPINVLCFYLDAQQQDQKSKKKNDKKKFSDHQPTMSEYLYDHERLIKGDRPELMLYTHSVEDPRFRKLQATLIPPRVPSDGYLQLSPCYYKPEVPVKRWKAARHRGIVLPRFYTRNQVASRESKRSTSSNWKDSEQHDTTFPDVEADDISSLSELSEKESNHDSFKNL